MSLTRIPAALRQHVWTRAAGACEYCRIHEHEVFLPHEPDHIIAEQHGGASSATTSPPKARRSRLPPKSLTGLRQRTSNTKFPHLRVEDAFRAELPIF